MSNWAIDDQHGNQLGGGYQDEDRARTAAQQLANERGEVVPLYADGVEGSETVHPACQHPSDKASTETLLTRCPDCGAECSETSIGDDGLCYDEACPLHVMAGPAVDARQ